jgi:hypothetical protein
MLLDAIPDLEMTGASASPCRGEVPSPIAPPTGLPLPPALPLRHQGLAP